MSRTTPLIALVVGLATTAYAQAPAKPHTDAQLATGHYSLRAYATSSKRSPRAKVRGTLTITRQGDQVWAELEGATLWDYDVDDEEGTPHRPAEPMGPVAFDAVLPAVPIYDGPR